MRGLLLVKRMMVVLWVCSAASLLQGQAAPTAGRTGVLQVGGGLVGADSGMDAERFRGGFVFADLDVSPHFGAEIEVRQVNTPNNDKVYERSYEAGVRYRRVYGRVEPFGKAMVGRGVYHYPYGAATIAYNLYAVGVGADVRVTQHVFARAEYEYQHWVNFAPGTLSPSIVEVGVAYRF